MLEFHIVDDAEVDRYILSRVIRSVAPDAKIIEHATAEEFLSFIESKRDDNGITTLNNMNIILDLKMPGIGGLEALLLIEKAVKQAELDISTTRLFVLTSSSHENDKKQVKQFSFVSSFHTKPVTANILQEMLKSPICV